MGSSLHRLNIRWLDTAWANLSWRILRRSGSLAVARLSLMIADPTTGAVRSDDAP